METLFKYYTSCCVCWLILSITQVSQAIDCDPLQHDERVTVKYVYDGDTVLDSNNRKIRLIGLDTPELGGKKQKGEPYADAARDFLRRLVADKNRSLILHFDTQKKDRYQRLLAHAFLPDGKNVAQLLLLDGLATALILPPNTAYADCYLAAQDSARLQRRGIWQLPEYQVSPLSKINVNRLPRYRLITARVAAKREMSNYLELVLRDHQQQLSLLIRNSERANFGMLLKQDLVGSKVRVQGWINKRKNKLQLYLRHPGYIRVLTD